MKADFEPVRDFTKVHNALFTLYTRLPDFKAEHAMLYTYLMARFNPSYGYAFPTSCDIALALNCGINQVTAYKRVLKKYGLIATRRHPTYGNDVYTLRAPIVEEAEFYAAFPDASDYYERRLAQLSARKERTDKADAVEDTGEMAALAGWL